MLQTVRCDLVWFFFPAGLRDAVSQGGVRQNAPHAHAAGAGTGTGVREVLPALLTLSAVGSLYLPQDQAPAVGVSI